MVIKEGDKFPESSFQILKEGGPKVRNCSLFVLRHGVLFELTTVVATLQER